MIRKLIYSLLFLGALSLGSCRNECTDCDFRPIRPKHSRILFHYLAMDNGLASFGRQNLNDMLLGATAENIDDGGIVIFSDMPNLNSQLLYIYAGSDGKPQMHVLFEWNQDLDSADPATFTTAFEKTRELIDCDSWVLGTGSHGSGWMPKSMHSQYLTRSQLFKTSDPLPLTRALLNDGAAYMDINSFVAAIPDDTFDFIFMDMCFMGGVEFAYAMRNKTRYLVLSPAEVMARGMPYDRVLSHIFADTPRLGEGGVCEEYYDYYMNDFPGDKFATIALYDCTKLETLAAAVQTIVTPKEEYIRSLPKNYISAEIQYFDQYSKHTMFDLREFVYDIHPDDDAARRTFDSALESAVVYKKTTGQPFGYSLIIPEERYSGISSYIPIGEYDALNEFYWQTDWAAAVYRN